MQEKIPATRRRADQKLNRPAKEGSSSFVHVFTGSFSQPQSQEGRKHKRRLFEDVNTRGPQSQQEFSSFTMERIFTLCNKDLVKAKLRTKT